jgi:tetratricopeptide (TPR) repeat protein
MDPNQLFNQAAASIKAKRFEEARRTLMEVVRLNPRHEQAWLALASVLSDMDQVVDCLKRALAINPNNPTAREWLDFAEQEKSRQAAVMELKTDTPAEIALDDPEDESRPVPRLGKYLLDYKFITAEQLRVALTTQRTAAESGQSKRLGDILLEQGAITEERLNFAIREQHRSFYSLFND